MPPESVAQEGPPPAPSTREACEVIEIDLGKLGKARLHRPTPLEVAALVVLLTFLGLMWVFR